MFICICVSVFVFLCVQIFLIFIRWFVHWRNQTLCDSIEMSMNIFGRIFANIFYLFFSFIVWFIVDMHKYTEPKKRPFELKQTKQGKKHFAQGHIVCQFRPNFIYLTSHIFFSVYLFANAICLIVCAFCVCFFFALFRSRGNLFWLLFLFIWLSVVHLSSTSLSITYTHALAHSQKKDINKILRQPVSQPVSQRSCE